MNSSANSPTPTTIATTTIHSTTSTNITTNTIISRAPPSITKSTTSTNMHIINYFIRLLMN